MDYVAPSRLAEALELVATGDFLPVAGGTDFYPSRVGSVIDGRFLDLTNLSELRGTEVTSDGVRIGALTTWWELGRADLPESCRSLLQAARLIGGVQVQHAGTIGGNLCNASPAADGIPPLLALDAHIELASNSGTRRIALADFMVGYRKTDLRPDELLTSVIIPASAMRGSSAFLKLGSRSHLVISIVMVAARLELASDGTIELARVAVGACSPTARRLHSLESSLEGLASVQAAGRIDPSHLGDLAPIDDPRAPAEYRMEAARVLVGRALAASLTP